MTEEWTEFRLDQLCLRITDGAHQSPRSVQHGLPMASVKDLTPHGLNLDSCRHISATDFERLVRQGCQPKSGDVLIAKDGASALDTVCLLREDINAVLLSSIAILRPDTQKILPRYLRFFLDSERTRRYMKGAFITGAAIPRVVLEDFKQVRIKTPPLPVQRKIASILSAYDDLIENNARRIKLLEELARLVYQEWFVRFRYPGHETVPLVDSELGPIPQGWKAGVLADICQEVRRGTDPAQVDPETPHVGLEHIPRRSIALTEWGKAGDIQSTKLRFERGEILFGKIRPYFHKVCVAPIRGICSSDAIVIRPNRPEFHAVTLMCVSSVEFVNHATQTSQGTKMPRANWEVLQKYPVALPPAELLNSFNEMVDRIVQIIRNKIFTSKNLRETRDLLLPRLVSGEVDVSELDIDVGEVGAA